MSRLPFVASVLSRIAAAVASVAITVVLASGIVAAFTSDATAPQLAALGTAPVTTA